MIIPRTSGCNLKRPDLAEQEALKLIDSVGQLNPLFTATINDIFSKFDLIDANVIEFKEFK